MTTQKAFNKTLKWSFFSSVSLTNVDTLKYSSNEYILDSVDFGIPNQRPRYYGVFTSDSLSTNHNHQLEMCKKSSAKILLKFSLERMRIINLSLSRVETTKKDIQKVQSSYLHEQSNDIPQKFLLIRGMRLAAIFFYFLILCIDLGLCESVVIQQTNSTYRPSRYNCDASPWSMPMH